MQRESRSSLMYSKIASFHIEFVCVCVCLCKFYFAFKIAPNDSYCLYPFPCVIPSPWVWPGKFDGMSSQRLNYQISGFYPGCSLSLFLSCSLWWKPGAMLQPPIWKGSHVARNWERPPENRKGRLESFTQHPVKKWVLPTPMWVSLEVDPSLLEPSDGTAAHMMAQVGQSWLAALM